MLQQPKIEIEIVIGRKLVRERRAQLALLKRKSLVLDELEEKQAGEIFLGEIGSNEK